MSVAIFFDISEPKYNQLICTVSPKAFIFQCLNSIIIFTIFPTFIIISIKINQIKLRVAFIYLLNVKIHRNFLEISLN